MTAPVTTPPGLSRRYVLAGGLAGGFLLAFHMPVRAADKPA
jgi:isoquinoline 1-oxidoreductase beta subunit